MANEVQSHQQTVPDRINMPRPLDPQGWNKLEYLPSNAWPPALLLGYYLLGTQAQRKPVCRKSRCWPGHSMGGEWDAECLGHVGGSLTASTAGI